MPKEHGISRCAGHINEVAPRPEAILSDGNGIHIFRYEFIEILRKTTVGGVIFLASRHDSPSIRLGDPELKGVVGLNKPQRQGWN